MCNQNFWLARENISIEKLGILRMMEILTSPSSSNLGKLLEEQGRPQRGEQGAVAPTSEKIFSAVGEF